MTPQTDNLICFQTQSGILPTSAVQIRLLYALKGASGLELDSELANRNSGTPANPWKKLQVSFTMLRIRINQPAKPQAQKHKDFLELQGEQVQ